MSLFDRLPEPSSPLHYLPSDSAERTQARLMVIESTFDAASHICRSLFESVQHGDYQYRSTCIAYSHAIEQVETALADLKKLMEEQSVGRETA